VPLQVLIVDDHASFRRLASRVLTEAGFEVVGEAIDGASAVHEAAALRPDVVLLDIVLPDRSGLAVAAELTAGPHAPRVVLTSSRGRSDFGTAFEWPAGCEFVPKHRLTGTVLVSLLGAR
jgi:DNA-binding NarL/FixJ family response regulator